MTSRIGKFGGFSLLEVLITLAIIAMFSGFFLLRFDGTGETKSLENAAAELKQVALLAKKRASTFRRDHYIVFDRGRYVLTDRKPVKAGQDSESGLPQNAESYQIPANLQFEVLRFGETRWIPMRKQVWRFKASGLNDPLGFRFSVDQSYVTLTFDALTGLAEEESVYE